MPLYSHIFSKPNSWQGLMCYHYSSVCFGILQITFIIEYMKVAWFILYSAFNLLHVESDILSIAEYHFALRIYHIFCNHLPDEEQMGCFLYFQLCIRQLYHLYTSGFLLLLFL